MGLGDPDCSIICWLFCRTMDLLWFYMGILFSSISILAGIMLRYNNKYARLITLIAGILLIPTGLLNFIAYFYVRQ
jgi:cytochrome c biogenesis protein CcdA